MRFRTVLAWVVIAPLTLASLAVIGAMYVNAARRSGEAGQALLTRATDEAAQHVAAQCTRAAELATSLAALAHGGLDLDHPDKLGMQLLGLLRAHDGITWISFSTPTGRFTGAFRNADGIGINQSAISNGKTAMTEVLVGAGGKQTPYRSDPDSGYDPRERPFYKLALAARAIAWSDPYIFYEQGVPGISCVLAVRGAGVMQDPMDLGESFDSGEGNGATAAPDAGTNSAAVTGSPAATGSLAATQPGGSLIGVISVDYDLNQLSSFVKGLGVSANSRMMIFTPDLTLIAHSAVSVMGRHGAGGNGTLLRLANVDDPATTALTTQLNPDRLAKLDRDGKLLLNLTSEGRRYLACVVPVKMMDGPVEYVAAVAPRGDFDPTPWQFSGAAIVIVAIALAAGGAAALLLATRLSRPLTLLAVQSQRIGAGEFDLTLNLGSLFEFKQLASALQNMLTDLRDWVRVRRSLDMAMDIQRSLLPAAAPKFFGFDIAGFSKYCDETGGDYFDYIPLGGEGPQRLLIVLGDVMGHGLPSAMMMAGARGVLRSDVLRQPVTDPNLGCGRNTPRNSPDEKMDVSSAASSSAPRSNGPSADDAGASALATAAATVPLRHCDGVAAPMLCHLNEILNHDTSGKRFMTMCLFIVDSAGQCAWSSAGHDPPLIFNPHEKSFTEPSGGGFPLGMFEDSSYTDLAVGPLKPGEIVFIGSDGVWETFRPDGEQFGKERVREVIEAHAGRTADQIKVALLDALDAFRQNAASRDDVTFVLVKFNGGGGG